MTKTNAIKILGSYAYHAQNNSIIDSRVALLRQFQAQNNIRNKDIEIEVNNNWSEPPAPKSARKYCKIGGTTYKYQLWAVVR